MQLIPALSRFSPRPVNNRPESEERVLFHAEFIFVTPPSAVASGKAAFSPRCAPILHNSTQSIAPAIRLIFSLLPARLFPPFEVLDAFLLEAEQRICGNFHYVMTCVVSSPESFLHHGLPFQDQAGTLRTL